MAQVNDAYRWVVDDFPGVAHGIGYAITLVHGLTPEAALARIGADGHSGYLYTGVEAQREVADATAEVDTGMFIAATPVASWTLLYEAVPATPESAEPMLEALSAGSRLVSHRFDHLYQARFHWAENGEIRTTFDPSYPADRQGSDPDSLLAPMQQVGFQLDADYGDVTVEDQVYSTFALSEHVTGIRITPQLLASAVFRCGTVPTLKPPRYA